MVEDPDTTGTLLVALVAGNPGAVLSASGFAGAVVTSNANMLSLSGTAAEVNAALASLEITEPAGVSGDTISLDASDPAVFPRQTGIAVDVVPQTGPAFVAPVPLVTLHSGSLAALPDLLLSDPVAQGLAAMGLGRNESLSLTLAADSGVLLLPGFSDAGAISASGLGSGTIVLDFTADQISAVNTLLAGLEFFGTGPSGELTYAVRNQAGVLPSALTFGNIYLNIIGSGTGAGTIDAGTQILQVGDETLSGTLAVAGVTTVLGNISGAGSIMVEPQGALTLPSNALFLGGTSLDFGQVTANELILNGALVVGGGDSFAGPLVLGTNSLLDFSGTMIAYGAAPADYAQAVTLAAGAVLSGDGTLQAGNFSASGLITGPGTLLAAGGATLSVSAGSIGGGAELAVAPGGVMVLGPSSPLFGVFDATAVTIDNSVILRFEPGAGAVPVSGSYAGTLGGGGGAFVITGPQLFSGTVAGFLPGDELIFPGLSFASVFGATSTSFVVGGEDGTGATVDYTIVAAVPSGDAVVDATDAAGDFAVGLRSAGATITQAASLAASAGVAQPLFGLSLEIPAATTQSLTLTLAASHGSLSEGTQGPAARLTLSAANLAAMNADLAALRYVPGSIAGQISIGSSTGVLAGLSALVGVQAGAPGVVNGYAGQAVSEAQTVSFGGALALSEVTAPLGAGEMLVTGTALFGNLDEVNGISGTALLVDAGGVAVFDAQAAVSLGAGVTIGDAGGAGTLSVLGDGFSTAGNITLAAAAAAAGSQADILGGVTAAGSLVIGVAAAANVLLGGGLQVAQTSLGNAGSLLAYGNAVASLGSVSDSGTITLEGAAIVQASSLLVNAGLTLGGTASLEVSGQTAMLGAAAVAVGGDATLRAQSYLLSAGTLAVAGQLTASSGMFDGAATTLTGGTVTGASFTLATAVMQGHGVVDAPVIVDDGTMIAQGGTLVLGGAVSVQSLLQAGDASDLVLTGSVSGSAIEFIGTDAMVTVDDPALLNVGFQRMLASDAIDLVGVTPNLVSYAGGTFGTLSIFDSLGNRLVLSSIEVGGGSPPVSLVSDGSGGTLITLGGDLPCFARGTGLLSPHGYRAVESLRPGDPLITAAGARRAVRWIGRRVLDFGGGSLAQARPVLIRPGAFGPGVPLRPLRLSPLHCVYADGVLVPAKHLVNGATIIREPVSAMTYYHVEMDRHDVLLADGLPCESYFDNGNRGALYHEAGRRSPARRAFAPSVTGGARLAAIRRRLHGIALAAGYCLTYWPVLRAATAGGSVAPEIIPDGHDRVARFAFPRPMDEVALFAQTHAPAETDPESEDQRELGVCIVPDDAIRPKAGFYARADGDMGLWMGKAGVLGLRRPVDMLVLRLAAVMQSWVPPHMPGREIDRGGRDA